jgi:hypothetical protein
MEYERALFRVYERCMEGFSEGTTSDNSSKIFSMCQRILSLCIVFFLFTLIYLHISFVGNPGCLPSLLDEYALSNNISNFKFRDDNLLYINVQDTFKDSFTSVATEPTMTSRYAVNETNSKYFKSTDVTTTVQNKSKPDYQYSSTWEILSLTPKVIDNHNFKVINITMSGSQCFGNSFTQALVPIGGMDVVVINSIMHTIISDGYLLSNSGEFYNWYKYSSSFSIVQWISSKIFILFNSILSFFFLSSITTILVRVLISSGVILFFPFFWLLQVISVV